MKTQMTNPEKVLVPALEEVSSLSYSSELVYRELDERPLQESNVIEQLHANMEQLQDLQGRLKSMMREIRYLMKV